MSSNHPIVGRWYEIRPGTFYRVDKVARGRVGGADWRRIDSNPGGFDGRFVNFPRDRFSAENVMPEGFHPRGVKNADRFARRNLRQHFDKITEAANALRGLGLNVSVSATTTEDFRLAVDHLPADLRTMLEADMLEDHPQAPEARQSRYESVPPSAPDNLQFPKAFGPRP